MKLNNKDNLQLIKKRSSKIIQNIFCISMVIAVAYVILYPILTKISIAFMSKSDMYDMSVNWIPKNPTFENFKSVFKYSDFWGAFINTITLSAFATIIQTATCALTAYGFARFEFKGKRILFLCVILMLIVPQQTYSTTAYLQFKNFNFFGILSLFGIDWSTSLINTQWPVLILSFGCAALKNGLFIYILRQFFYNLPKSLEEAAWVDGAGVLRIFRSVMLPNAIPALVTIMVFSFVWTWNDLYAAQTFMPSYPVFATFLSSLSYDMAAALRGEMEVIDTYAISTVTNAAALMIIAPILAFFFAAQRYFVEGIERTGLTGM